MRIPSGLILIVIGIGLMIACLVWLYTGGSGWMGYWGVVGVALWMSVAGAFLEVGREVWKEERAKRNAQLPQS